jgi:hypothetical protein
MEPGNFWGSWVVAALGIWDVFAFGALNYDSHFAIAANEGVIGGLIFMFAFWTIATDHEWSSWASLGLGAWLVLSGAAFEHTVTKAMVNDIIVGVLVMAFSYISARHARAAWERGFTIFQEGGGGSTQ